MGLIQKRRSLSLVIDEHGICHFQASSMASSVDFLRTFSEDLVEEVLELFLEDFFFFFLLSADVVVELLPFFSLSLSETDKASFLA